ncbi:hypothetical protein FQN57_003518 [Myotisia sp. PD_48]|nr:hypothetical protein FQN57_003518 [Myotisia sp. PD_48]
MSLSIYPITSSDLPRLLDIQRTALQHSGFFRACGEIPNPDGFPDDAEKYPDHTRRQHQTDRYLSSMQNDSTFHLLKCVNDAGDILAIARWHVYVGQEGMRIWKDQHRLPGEDMIVPTGVNDKGWQYCQGKLIENRRLFFGDEGREHCLLALLCTDPKYERRGAGSLLTNWGLEVAEKYGIEAYVESSKFGLPVYLRRGFGPIPSTERQTADLEFDVSQFTGRGVGVGGGGDWARLKLMVKKPSKAVG